jgi:phytoene/squalene synthetase
MKNVIINDIECDFSASLPGIKKLPADARLPVLIAYYYYLTLLKKIRKTTAEQLINKRIRISDLRKFILLSRAYLEIKLGIF